MFSAVDVAWAGIEAGLDRRCMKTILFGIALALLVPATVSADPPPAAADAVKDGRLVPAMRNGKPEGLKLYAIRANGRFDQPTAKFQNGDTIISVDDQAVTDQLGALALHERVILGKADATVVVARAGTRVTLVSKAIR